MLRNDIQMDHVRPCKRPSRHKSRETLLAYYQDPVESMLTKGTPAKFQKITMKPHLHE